MALQIEVGANLQQAVQELKTLGKAIENTTSTLGKINAPAQAASDAISEIGASAKSIGDKFEQARQRIHSNIDKMVADALEASKAVKQIGTSRIPLGSIEEYRRSILSLKKDIASVKLVANDTFTGQFEKISTVVKKSSKDFTNLSRVIQDLPFGLIGIQNNLTQLLPAAGGLGLAFSALVSGVTFAQTGFANWTRGLGSSSKAVNETKDRIKELTRSMDDIRESSVGGTEEELAKVQILSKVVLDQTESYKKRNAALNQLKEINKNYFGDLTLEQSKLGALKAAVDDYTNAIIQQAVIKGFSEEIGKVAIELSKQEKAFSKSGDTLRKYQGELDSLKNKTADADKVLEKTGNFQPQRKLVEQIGTAQTEVIRQNKAFEEQGKIVGTLRKQMFDLRQEVEKAVDITLDLKPLDAEKTTKDNKKEKTEFLFQFFPFDPNGKLKPEQKAELLQAIQKFEKDFTNTLEGVDFSFRANGDTDRTIGFAKDFWLKIQRGLIRFKPDKLEVGEIPPVEIFDSATTIKSMQRVQDEINRQGGSGLFVFRPDVDRKLLLDRYTQAFEKAGQALPKKVKLGETVMEIDLATNLSALDKSLAEMLALVQARVKLMQDVVSTIALETFAALGQGLADVITGGGLSEAFSRLFQTIGGILQDFGKQLIVMSSLFKILKEAITKVDPTGGIIAGIGLVALGGILKNIKPKGFAEGGLVFGPTVGLIGEGRGTSRTNPEVIAPLDKLMAMLQGSALGGRQVVVLETVIRGTDLALTQARTDKRLGRAF
jgi:hypothetical protein